MYEEGGGRDQSQTMQVLRVIQQLSDSYSVVFFMLLLLLFVCFRIARIQRNVSFCDTFVWSVLMIILLVFPCVLKPKYAKSSERIEVRTFFKDVILGYAKGLGLRFYQGNSRFPPIAVNDF